MKFSVVVCAALIAALLPAPPASAGEVCRTMCLAPHIWEDVRMTGSGNGYWYAGIAPDYRLCPGDPACRDSQRIYDRCGTVCGYRGEDACFRWGNYINVLHF